mgnify:CR=1 FL=1
MLKDYYKLDWYQINKKIPLQYRKLAIPEIEKITKNIQGDYLKIKLYNYLIHYYNKGIKKGIFPTISIFSNGIVKKISFVIDNNKVKLNIIKI